MADEKLEKARLVRVLKTVPLFSGLDEKGLGAIAAVGREVTFESGKTILKQGEPGLAFLLVLEGKAEVRKKGRPVATLERGGFLGEMTVIDDKPRSADVVALEPTRCFGIVSWSFLPVLRRHPDVAIGIISELVKRLRRLEESPSE